MAKPEKRAGLSRREFLRLSAAAGAASIVPSPGSGDPNEKPNLISILCDDLGWGDLHCYGHSQIKSPNLDRLARQGTLFTSFYSCSAVCSPSRAAFLTGRYAVRDRIHHALTDPLTEDLKEAGTAPFLDPGAAALGPALRSAGYVTAHIGKWHLGTGDAAPEIKDYGFDHCRALLGNGPEDIRIPNASHSGVGSPGPFRGRKRSLYEGGIRMPFIARWPGGVPAGRVNASSALAAVDFLPTLCALAGAGTPEHSGIDGEDAKDILRGSGHERRKPLYWDWRFTQVGHPIDFSPQLAIRDGDWKLLANRDGSRTELYNLREDPMEVDNRSAQEPGLTKKLSERLLSWAGTLPPGKSSPDSGRNDYPWPK